MPTIYPPYVIERSQKGERSYDIFSRLLMDRIIFLGTPINDDVANIVIAQLLFLEADNPERDISIYINSPGGSVSAGLAIYDTMQFLHCEIATYCLGQAASMASFLLAAGTRGKRYALLVVLVIVYVFNIKLLPLRGDGINFFLANVIPFLNLALAGFVLASVAAIAGLGGAAVAPLQFPRIAARVGIAVYAAQESQAVTQALAVGFLAELAQCHRVVEDEAGAADQVTRVGVVDGAVILVEVMEAAAGIDRAGIVEIAGVADMPQQGFRGVKIW